MVLFCILDEMNGPVASLENARDFLFQKNILEKQDRALKPSLLWSVESRRGLKILCGQSFHLEEETRGVE